MAPVIRSFTSAGAANSPTASVSKPAGLAVNDYLLAFQETDSDGALSLMTAPGGFVALGSQDLNSSSNIPAGKVWGKVATTTDVNASSFAFPDATGANCSVVLLAIQAGTYDTTTPLSGLAWQTQGNASNANIIAPSITGANNALLLTAHMPDIHGTLRSFTTAPSGMTLVVQSTAGAADWTRIAVYSQVLTSSAATGTKTAVLDGTPSGYIATALRINGPSTAAPTVGAGADVTGHPVDTEFTRTATENANGATITSRAWTIQAGTGSGSTIGTAAALSWTPTSSGSYTLRYSATNSVDTGTDDMTITVVDPPGVDAGADAVIDLGDTFTRTAIES